MTFDEGQRQLVLASIEAKEVIQHMAEFGISNLYARERQRKHATRFILILVSNNASYSFPDNMESELIKNMLRYDVVMFDLRFEPSKSPSGMRRFPLGTDKMLDLLIDVINTHYVISFKPAHEDIDSQPHTIEIEKVDRSGVPDGRYSVYHRETYTPSAASKGN